MELSDYGISNAEEAFFGLQSPTSPKGKHFPILRQQENNRIAKTLAEKTHNISINFQSIPKCWKLFSMLQVSCISGSFLTIWVTKEVFSFGPFECQIIAIDLKKAGIYSKKAEIAAN